MQKVFIKNMVCPRCIQAVRTTFEELNLQVVNIQLGEVSTPNELNDEQKQELKLKLKSLGFELIDNSKNQLVERIKTLLINHIQHSDNPIHINYSDYLSKEIGKDYRYLSSLFPAFTGITIEKYIIQLKVEKIKEYMFYEELSISEIAYKMNYSSPAHLSRQFKQVCGLSPKDYKQQIGANRKSLDQI